MLPIGLGWRQLLDTLDEHGKSESADWHEDMRGLAGVAGHCGYGRCSVAVVKPASFAAHEGRSGSSTVVGLQGKPAPVSFFEKLSCSANFGQCCG
jgi:hypothetical protein